MKLRAPLAALLGRLWPFVHRREAELLELAIDISESTIRRQNETIAGFAAKLAYAEKALLTQTRATTDLRRENGHLYDMMAEDRRAMDAKEVEIFALNRWVDDLTHEISRLRNPRPVDFAYPLPYWLSAVIIVDQRETTATVEGTAGWPGSDLSRPFGLG